ncbi:GPW/gp25 family protein [Shewanella halifaxensis]|uniref:GPW/gp25 family protein n=1 Tax=Shewanella halifaxensis TaxID=271098 RepID=UPI000D598AE3|nr:GPW/gp25 family protein [Shewanella halifaxensis]
MYAIRLNGTGRCETLIEDIMQSIRMIVFTPKGSRIFDNEYGCSAMDYVDRPQWELQKLIIDMTRSIAKYETRIELSQIIIDAAKLANGEVSFKLTFTLVETGESLEQTLS